MLLRCLYIHTIFLVSFNRQRRILSKPKKNQRTKQKQLRPRSRTLTAVHDAMLEDLVYPAEIIGKRIRVRLDGTRLIKVHLDKTQQTNIEHKVCGCLGVISVCTCLYVRGWVWVGMWVCGHKHAHTVFV